MKLYFTLIFLMFSLVVFSQTMQQKLAGVVIDTNSSKNQNIMINCGCGNRSPQKLFFIIDGKPFDSIDQKTISPDKIENLSIVKSPLSKKIFGERAKDGAVIIFMKHTDSLLIKPATLGQVISLRDPASRPPKDLFFIIDGLVPDSVRFNGSSLNVFYKGEKRVISSDEIEKSQFLSDARTNAIYGSRAANGAIIMTTKRK